MKTTLRGHHLICLHFYRGKGYSADFVENLNELMAEVRSKGALVVSGADDVCVSCPHLRADRCELNGASDEDVRSMDTLALSLLNLKTGDRIEWQEIRDRLPMLISKWRDLCCLSCIWFKVCEITDVESSDVV